MPLSFVVTVDGDTLPVSALMVISTPDIVPLEEFFAVIVMFAAVDPSDATDGGDAMRSKEAGTTVVFVVLLPPPPVSTLPPQAAKENIAKRIKRFKEKTLLFRDLDISFSFSITEIDDFFNFNDYILTEILLIFKIFFELSMVSMFYFLL